MVSLPPPPIAVSITVLKAMPILLVKPLPLLKLPGSRLMIDGVDHPERSSLLFTPKSQIVTTGCVFWVKSK
jgi:hypothetical protein